MPPLFRFLPHRVKFVEPCGGAGHMIDHLTRAGHECVAAFDILPERADIQQADVLFFDFTLPPCDKIITNPPWERDVLHEMIERFRIQADTWLLFDADWMHNLGSTPYLAYCSQIIAVGRLSWEDNGVSGMDNCCWYNFQKEECKTIFHPRLTSL